MQGSKYGEVLGLAERLVAVRKRRCLRQRDVAREIGFSRKTIVRIENDYVAGPKTRAKVTEWLEAQEAAGAARAATVKGSVAKPSARRDAKARAMRRARAMRIGLPAQAGLVIQKKVAQAFKEAEAERKARLKRRLVRPGVRR